MVRLYVTHEDGPVKGGLVGRTRGVEESSAGPGVEPGAAVGLGALCAVIRDAQHEYVFEQR
jgi:hypothetical protein